MRLAGIMHEEAHLLNGVGDVGPSQREILQSSSKAAVLGSILHRSPIRSRELGTSVHRSRCRVTLGHASTLEQIHSVLVLREEEAVNRTRDRDLEEVMKIPEICHGELGVKELGDATEECSRRSCQDDVVDVEQQVGDVDALFVNKERRVRSRSSEARLLDEAGEPLVPGPGRLLESIQGLLQEADVVGGRRVNEAGLLLQ